MATVSVGQQRGDGGFSRVVAIKEIHPHLAVDRAFVTMFCDEARLASRVKHPNVVPIVDVVDSAGATLLVMDYIHGTSLSQVLHAIERRETTVPVRVALRILSDVLHGLDAIHQARDDDGSPLELIHRDITPHNLLVGEDGTTRIIDFGVAKAKNRLQETLTGEIKGKPGYIAPEQVSGASVDPRADLFAFGVTAWELLTGRRAFKADTATAVIVQALAAQETLTPPHLLESRVPRDVSEMVMRAMHRDPRQRPPSAAAMLDRLEEHLDELATPREVAAWLKTVAKEVLSERAAIVRRVERSSREEHPSDIPVARAEDASTVGGLSNDGRSPRPRWPLPALLVLLLGGVGAGWLARGQHATGAPTRTVVSHQAVVDAARASQPGPAAIDHVEPSPTASTTPAPPIARPAALPAVPLGVRPSAATTPSAAPQVAPDTKAPADLLTRD